jgi:hypothetical protein
METLGEKQGRFAVQVAQLILWAQGRGMRVRFGEAYRTPEQALLNSKSGKGIVNSLHTQRLAVDLLLDINGKWQTLSEAYRPMGEFWKSLSPDARWGGDFRPKVDGNHFSLEHQGVK